MPVGTLKLSEIVGALSYALDITEGQPPGHCIRCCWIGMHIAEEAGVDAASRWDLYYTLLLKDLGCSSNAARICELYLANDLDFKRNYKEVDGSTRRVVEFVLRNTGLKAGLAKRFEAVSHIFMYGTQISRELIESRCTRGADIAKQLRFGPAVSEGIRSLDEHWNGQGKAQGLAGEAIPLFSRIALLSQVIDVFHQSGGKEKAVNEVLRRSAVWFDPGLVNAFIAVADRPEFWRALESPEIHETVLASEPAQHEVDLDDDYLDEISAGFALVVDSKSPYTAGHSDRVAQFAEAIAGELGFDAGRLRWLRRAALLHDIGKLGVSNSILDKPGKLTDAEWVDVRKHPEYSQQILSRIEAFADIAEVGGAHHEKLDGSGYPHRLKGELITLDTRIVTTADIFDAITAKRPYRDPIPVEKALDMMRKDVGAALDAQCFDALVEWLKKSHA